MGMAGRISVIATSLALGAFTSAAIPQENRSAVLVGLWQATRNFTADVRGTLLLIERQGRVVADVAGYVVPVLVREGTYAFELPDNNGSFRGHKAQGGREIHGELDTNGAAEAVERQRQIEERWELDAAAC